MVIVNNNLKAEAHPDLSICAVVAIPSEDFLHEWEIVNNNNKCFQLCACGLCVDAEYMTQQVDEDVCRIVICDSG